MTDELENNEQPSPEVVAQETEARQFGWAPKDEYKGDPDKWRDAATFLQRGKEINGFLRKDLQKIQDAHARELSEIKQSVEEIKKIYNESSKQAYARAVADLKAEKVVAIEQGDGARVVELDDQIDKIKEAQTTKDIPVNQSPQKNDKEYYQWLDKNPWYITDSELANAAEKFGDIIHANNPNLKGRPFLDAVTEKVKEAFGDKFENPNRSNSQVSNSSDSRAPANKGKKKSYENLPAEGKAQCDKFVAQGLMTRDEYIATLDWSDLI